jgi:uncharacterized repeat protein (TIGR04076 family)
MAERYKVGIRVVSQIGSCVHEHRLGQEWLCEGKTPQGICIKAFSSLLPQIWFLRLGGSFPWEVDPGVTRIACPDPVNPVVFELRRLPE